MKDFADVIIAVTNESQLAVAALMALHASEDHLRDAQAQIDTLKSQIATSAIDPAEVTKLLDTVSATTAQLSAAIPANVATDPAKAGPAPTVVVVDAGTATAVQARDAAGTALPIAAAGVGAPAVAAQPGTPGAFAQPTETATAGLAAGPGPAAPTIVQP